MPENRRVYMDVCALCRPFDDQDQMRIHLLTLPRERRLESVRRHRQWQKSLDQEQFFGQVFGTRDEQDAS